MQGEPCAGRTGQGDDPVAGPKRLQSVNSYNNSDKGDNSGG
ncbi:hypothetical protein [Streptomyces sp. NPDC001315]